MPADFICPLTGEIFIEPVMIEDGNSYEKDAIKAWLEKHDTSPVTNEALASKDTMENKTLARLIEGFLEKA